MSVKNVYCLDIEDGTYSLGDLNLMLKNKENVSYPPVDSENPARPFFTGGIFQKVTVEGEERPFLTYIPSRFPISGAGVFLYPDNGVTCTQCLEDGWRELAEKMQFALIILQARESGWSKENIQDEVTYSEMVFKKAICRTYFSLNEATYYIMGLGAGAYVATAHGLLSSSLFSCILADGDYQLDPRLLEQLGRIRSDRDSSLSKLDVPMPAWLVSHTQEAGGQVLECLMKANCTQDRGLYWEGTAVYQQDVRRSCGQLDALPFCEVRFTGEEEAGRIQPARLHEQMIAFALRFKRWLSIGNGCFRAARTAEDMGLKRFQAEIDGRAREWYVYEPTAHRKNPVRKLPLLLAIHGYSCTGSIFAENSEWHAVGERRDFFVVYVSAYPSNLAFGGHTVPLPTWNAVGMPAETDDIHYIQEVLKAVKADYPIDPERVYVSGHSNGSLMTQTLMAKLPREFAAFAPQGAQFHMALHGDPQEAARRDIPDDGIVRPVWLMMGSEDLGDQDRIEPGNANDRFLTMMCRVNCLEREAGQLLENGRYRTWTFADRSGVPLVRFSGIQDTPHTYTPEMAQIYWDQFLCHFRRKADGSVVYTM
jgi:poly(3-hydroxybutyrate) depolymerase